MITLDREQKEMTSTKTSTGNEINFLIQLGSQYKHGSTSKATLFSIKENHNPLQLYGKDTDVSSR